MLNVRVTGSQGPTVVMLHWLGGTAESWNEVAQELLRWGVRSVAIDLPGFGGSADVEPADVAMMAAQAIAAVRSVEPIGDWFLIGHSMGGKVAAVLTHEAERGDGDLAGLRGVMLVSPSPVSPEPMQESKRAEVIEKLGSDGADTRRDFAREFVKQNTGKLALSDAVLEDAVEQVMASRPSAFRRWMEAGSREDWSERVGVLATPTIVFAGTAEAELGADQQRLLTAAHFSNVTVTALEGAGHLSPIERPAELALRFAQFMESRGVSLQRQTEALNDTFIALIDSAQTSSQTRAVMKDRLRSGKGASSIFSEETSVTLHALVHCIVPQAGFDLARKLEDTLAQRAGDGWRFDALPADPEAWTAGLATLNHASIARWGVNFAALDQEKQQMIVQAAQDGELHRGVAGALHLGARANDATAAQMKLWIEDVRGDLARLYVADPRAMQRIGFDGFADNNGFVVITNASEVGA
ncbi:alpha/beta fold hydrolase [Granulicella cerasi]|uniref:Alpha/beta fold hydrolase n=1 Tax=Granulicella cerasi TaxID=741063 RepID=A0ABW1ZC13_9BACT|nr:alpha/beta hydrolase [Granulicella cerasi]